MFHMAVCKWKVVAGSFSRLPKGLAICLLLWHKIWSRPLILQFPGRRTPASLAAPKIQADYPLDLAEEAGDCCGRSVSASASKGEAPTHLLYIYTSRGTCSLAESTKNLSCVPCDKLSNACGSKSASSTTAAAPQRTGTLVCMKHSGALGKIGYYGRIVLDRCMSTFVWGGPLQCVCWRYEWLETEPKTHGLQAY